MSGWEQDMDTYILFRILFLKEENTTDKQNIIRYWKIWINLIYITGVFRAKSNEKTKNTKQLPKLS